MEEQPHEKHWFIIYEGTDLDEEKGCSKAVGMFSGCGSRE